MFVKIMSFEIQPPLKDTGAFSSDPEDDKYATLKIWYNDCQYFKNENDAIKAIKTQHKKEAEFVQNSKDVVYGSSIGRMMFYRFEYFDFQGPDDAPRRNNDYKYFLINGDPLPTDNWQTYKTVLCRKNGWTEYMHVDAAGFSGS